jgi:hypothetical protein
MDTIQLSSATTSGATTDELRAALYGLLKSWNKISEELPLINRLDMDRAVKTTLRRGFAQAPALPMPLARIEKVESVDLGYGFQGILKNPKWRVLAGPPGREQSFDLETESEANALKAELDRTVPSDFANLPHQAPAAAWASACFGADVATDTLIRAVRGIEEMIELIQSIYAASVGNEAGPVRCHKQVDQTLDRPVVDAAQEAGGAMVTTSPLCQAADVDMESDAET